jgi:hypothetical protein
MLNPPNPLPSFCCAQPKTAVRHNYSHSPVRVRQILHDNEALVRRLGEITYAGPRFEEDAAKHDKVCRGGWVTLGGGLEVVYSLQGLADGTPHLAAGNIGNDLCEGGTLPARPAEPASNLPCRASATT